MTKHIANYVRLSTKKQDTTSQEPDLKRWAATQTEVVKWYQDNATGTNMNRTAWERLMEAIRLGHVSSVVCWRIDHLGRIAKGLPRCSTNCLVSPKMGSTYRPNKG